MEVVHTQCAGLDVHKKTVVAAIILPDGQGGLRKEVQTCNTMTADHQAAWAGVVPGNNESAGKRYFGTTHKGNRPLNVALVLAAQAASHTRNTYLSSQYHRLAGRRDKKRAIVAVAHSILLISHCIMQRKEPCRELGGGHFDKQRPESIANRLLKHLQRQGYDISNVA